MRTKNKKVRRRKLFDVIDPMSSIPGKTITVKAFNKDDALQEVLKYYNSDRFIFDIDAVKRAKK